MCNWFGTPEIHTWRSWHNIGAACRPQPVSYGCCVFKRHWCSPSSRITLSKMQCQHFWMKSGTSKKHIKETAVHTHWCGFQQTTNWICIIFASISRIDTTSYIANHTKRSLWKIFKEHHGLLKNLGIGELTDDAIQSSETFVCRIFSVHRTDAIDAARTCCSPRQGNQKQWPQQVMRSVFTWRESIVNRWYGEMPTAPRLSSLRPQKWDGDLWIQNCIPYW